MSRPQPHGGSDRLNIPTPIASPSLTDPTVGYFPSPCHDPACGHPQDGPGRPRRGWIQTRAAGAAIWHCSWHCLSRHAIRQELAGAR